MPHKSDERKSYDADEIEQKLIHQIRRNSSLNNMMDESAPPILANKNRSSLYMDDVELSDDYASMTPPAVTVLNMDRKARHHLDDKETNKHGRYYRNTVGPITISVIGTVFIVAILAVVIVSTGNKNTQVAQPNWIDATETVETQLTNSHTPITVTDPSSKSKGEHKDDFVVVLDNEEGGYFYEDYEDEEQDQDEDNDDYDDEGEYFDYEDEMVCVPTIKLHQELHPESMPVVASDGNTIAVQHGKKLNFYEQDRTQSYAYMTLPQTHARNTNINEPNDLTFAMDGSSSIIGDYLREDKTGAVYVLKGNGEGQQATTQVIVAPEDVEVGGMFGFSVDIFGDRLIVGAPLGYGEGSGSAYIYERTDEGTWEIEHIFPPNEEDGPKYEFELYGESVAIHKNRVAVSGYNEFDEVTVFIYEYSAVSDAWEEIDDIIVEKHCQDCTGVGVAVSFRDDGGLFISYPRKSEINYLVPSSFDNGGEYAVVQKIYVDEDGDVGMDQVQVSGEVMVVGVTDEDDFNLVYVYSQSHDDDKWVKVDEIELPENPTFDPEHDFIDLALSRSNLIVNYGDDKLIWYTFDGCE